jgi:hypothetical protein
MSRKQQGKLGVGGLIPEISNPPGTRGLTRRDFFRQVRFFRRSRRTKPLFDHAFLNQTAVASAFVFHHAMVLP